MRLHGTFIFWPNNNGFIVQGGKRRAQLIRIEAVRMSEYIDRRPAQNIGAEDVFRIRCIKYGKQMRMVLGRCFPMPPALGNVGYLAWFDQDVGAFIVNWVDEGNLCRTADAIDQL